MPELPDVEGFRRVLAEHTGEPIASVSVLDPGVLRGVTARRLSTSLRGHRFEEPHRHGKWLLAPAQGPVVLLHFGMTGSLTWHPSDDPRHRHDRVIWALPDGELRFRDMRKLQGIHLAANSKEADETVENLGPDALDLSRDDLTATLGAHRGRLKTTLTDQTIIAGLGNLLADEICWQARINPLRPARDLTAPEITTLHRALHRVLRDSLKAERVPPRKTWLTGARDTQTPTCPRCGTPLKSRRLSGRRTLWCPTCQPN